MNDTYITRILKFLTLVGLLAAFELLYSGWSTVLFFAAAFGMGAAAVLLTCWGLS